MSRVSLSSSPNPEGSRYTGDVVVLYKIYWNNCIIMVSILLFKKVGRVFISAFFSAQITYRQWSLSHLMILHLRRIYNVVKYRGIACSRWGPTYSGQTTPRSGHHNAVTTYFQHSKVYLCMFSLWANIQWSEDCPWPGSPHVPRAPNSNLVKKT